jgi:plastocyanin
MLSKSSLFLAAAVACFTACGSDSPTAPSAPANVVITIEGTQGNMSFSPASAAVRVGQTVAWMNADSISHEIAQDTAPGFSTPGIPPGATSNPVTITNAGITGYHCTIHPSMIGTLNVTAF